MSYQGPESLPKAGYCAGTTLRSSDVLSVSLDEQAEQAELLEASPTGAIAAPSSVATPAPSPSGQARGAPIFGSVAQVVVDRRPRWASMSEGPDAWEVPTWEVATTPEASLFSQSLGAP